MTTIKKLESMLVNNGMFQPQAEEVIKIAIPKLNELSGGYKITWDRPADEYPQAMYNLMFIAVKPIALKWIEENCPYAWYKDMFLN